MVVIRRTPLLAAALIAILLALAPSADAGKRRVPHGFFGVVWSGSVVGAPDEVQNEQWALMSRTGVESARVVFSWDRAQPAAGSGPSFDRTDRAVERALLHGVELLPVVLDTPTWARAFNKSYSPPLHAEDLAAYLRALVGRYGPSGTFWSDHSELPRRPIRHWQIWNEPDLSYRWYAPKGSHYAWPRGYATLLKVASRALKRSDRGAKVVLAGLTNDSWNHLAALYRRGARRFFDIGAIQTYTSSPKLALKAIRLYRRVMRRRRDGRKPIWATETGWPAAKGRMRVPRNQGGLVTTDRGMAYRLRAMWDPLARRRRLARYRVGRLFWYSWTSPYRPISDIFDFAGLQAYDRGQFAPKPALRSFRVIARRFEGCRKDSAGACVATSP